jgi:hypothetical protein
VEKQHASQPTTEAKTLGIKKRRSILDTDALLIETPLYRHGMQLVQPIHDSLIVTSRTLRTIAEPALSLHEPA